MKDTEPTQSSSAASHPYGKLKQDEEKGSLLFSELLPFGMVGENRIKMEGWGGISDDENKC